MGTEAHLVLVGAGDGVATHLLDLLGRLERRWSRFLPDSEVSHLNARAGQPVRVHPSTLLLVEQALEAWRLTGGAFDPTVLGDVVRAGDDTSLSDCFAGSLDRSSPIELAPGCSDLVRACSDIEVDHADSIVRLPPGTGFDPGGIGRGLAADLLVGEAAPGRSPSSTRRGPPPSRCSTWRPAPSPPRPRCAGAGRSPAAPATTSSIRAPASRRTPTST